MKIHMYQYHQITDTKSVKKSCVKSLSHQSVKKEEAVKRVRIASPAISDKTTELKDEYIQHYTTPKTSPEPSPIKKKIKENPTKEDPNNADNESNKFASNTIKDTGKAEVVHGPEEGPSPSNDDVANEVAELVQNFQDDIKVKDSRIKFLESEKQGIETKVKMLTTELKLSKEANNKVEQEKEVLHVKYVKCCKANQEASKETEKVKAEYAECAQQLNFSQRRSEQLAETLKVTEAILQAQEEDEDEEEDNTDAGANEDDDDYLEDEDDPGQLWQVVQQELNCKKCDEKVTGNKNLREHMQKHIQDQGEVLPCYYCEFKTSSEN